MVSYLIVGYEEKRIPEGMTGHEAIAAWFKENRYENLEPKLVFQESNKDMTVYICKYRTLYYETFIVEARKY